MRQVQHAMRKFVFAFFGLGAMLLVGFLLTMVTRNHLLEGAGATLMVGSMIVAGAIDIRLRSPHLRKLQ
ncbi:hypothetical protein [Alicyclobacillus acidiphilus]|uniref:hypothetical protein n=1 Tax=Alicyclobacillus acidiphilus TaxID=182455 RepID=UPI0008372C45|nr:hypothetical protein [Alicyclobacillus acidiphilus]